MYKLSLAPGMSRFKHVVLVASPQDKYVPMQSALIGPHGMHVVIASGFLSDLQFVHGSITSWAPSGLRWRSMSCVN